MYAEDATRATIALLDAPRDSLTRCVYDVPTISPSAEEIRDAILAVLPEAELTFDPREEVDALINSWPGRMLGEAIAQDIGFELEYINPARIAGHFIPALRARFGKQDSRCT